MRDARCRASAAELRRARARAASALRASWRPSAQTRVTVPVVGREHGVGGVAGLEQAEPVAEPERAGGRRGERRDGDRAGQLELRQGDALRSATSWVRVEPAMVDVPESTASPSCTVTLSEPSR